MKKGETTTYSPYCAGSGQGQCRLHRAFGPSLSGHPHTPPDLRICPGKQGRGKNKESVVDNGMGRVCVWTCWKREWELVRAGESGVETLLLVQTRRTSFRVFLRGNDKSWKRKPRKCTALQKLNVTISFQEDTQDCRPQRRRQSPGPQHSAAGGGGDRGGGAGHLAAKASQLWGWRKCCMCTPPYRVQSPTILSSPQTHPHFYSLPSYQALTFLHALLNLSSGLCKCPTGLAETLQPGSW